MHKRYLGDGVYVELTEIGLLLTTENGIETTNQIVLEPDVTNALTAYIEEFSARALTEE